MLPLTLHPTKPPWPPLHPLVPTIPYINPPLNPTYTALAPTTTPYIHPLTLYTPPSPPPHSAGRHVCSDPIRRHVLGVSSRHHGTVADTGARHQRHPHAGSVPTTHCHGDL